MMLLNIQLLYTHTATMLCFFPVEGLLDANIVRRRRKTDLHLPNAKEDLLCHLTTYKSSAMCHH